MKLSKNWKRLISVFATFSLMLLYCVNSGFFALAANSPGAGDIVPPVPTEITSSQFTVSKNSQYISKITVGTTVQTLWSGLNEKDFIVIHDKQGNIVTGSNVLKTGMSAAIMDEGTVTSRYTIIVTGDVNEDGMIDIADMVAVKAQVLGKGSLTDAKLKAGDVNKIPDGTIDIADFIRIKAHILKKDAISGVSVN